MDLTHECLPKRCGSGTAGGAGSKLLGILIVTDPQRSSVITGEACKIDACIVVVCTGLSGNGDAFDLRVSAGAVLNCIGEKIDEHVCGTLFEYSVRCLYIRCFKNRIALIVNYTGEADGIYVHSSVRDACVSGSHFKRGDIGGAECKARTGSMYP